MSEVDPYLDIKQGGQTKNPPKKNHPKKPKKAHLKKPTKKWVFWVF